MAPAQSEPFVNRDKLLSRYRDAYRVAKVVDGFGGICKIVGAVIGVVLGLVAFGGASSLTQNNSAASFLVGIVIGAVTWFLFFILGTLIAAYAQHLKASLDTSVSSTPLLHIMDKALIMGCLNQAAPPPMQ